MSEKKRKKQAILREAYKTSKIIEQKYREVESSESCIDEDSEDDARSNNKPAEESWQDRKLRSRKRSYFLSEEKSAIHLEPLNQGKKKRVHAKDGKEYESLRKEAWKTEAKLGKGYFQLAKAAKNKATHLKKQSTVTVVADETDSDQQQPYNCGSCQM